MKLNSNIRTILSKRGIQSQFDIEEFLSDKPQRTYDPFLLLNMEEGVDFVMSAIEDNRNICVYGDYDADGVTSVALLVDVLKELNANVSYYIPSRFDEGYGLNKNALDKIKAAGAEVVITVDCGSTSVEEVEYAKGIGLDVMVTDHHAVRSEVPDCIVINPSQPGCKYPFKSLAGVGVAFKLGQALCESMGVAKQVMTRNLDLVAIGTIGDVVPLVDENRTLVKYALRFIRISERIGLNALIDAIGLDKRKLGAKDISFSIVPHINAAGRMGDAVLAARLMQVETMDKAHPLVKKIRELNLKRKAIQNELYDECLKRISDEKADLHSVFIEFNDAHEGVIGIVAGKLKETFNKPAFILTEVEPGILKGTCRSPKAINIFDVLSHCSDLFERFGGHAAACGFTIKRENVDELKCCLESSISTLKSSLKERGSVGSKADISLSAEDLTDDFMIQQKLIEPFGKDNEQPIIELSVKVKDFSYMGSENQYLRFTAETENGRILRGVAFKNANKTAETMNRAISSHEKIKVLGNINLQIWKGKEYLQLIVLSAVPIDM